MWLGLTVMGIGVLGAAGIFSNTTGTTISLSGFHIISSMWSLAFSHHGCVNNEVDNGEYGDS